MVDTTPAPEKQLSPVERAEATVKRLDEQLASLDSKIRELNELRADKIVAGITSAGTKPEEPKIPTAKEYAQAASKGIILK